MDLNWKPKVINRLDSERGKFHGCNEGSGLIRDIWLDCGSGG